MIWIICLVITAVFIYFTVQDSFYVDSMDVFLYAIFGFIVFLMGALISMGAVACTDTWTPPEIVETTSIVAMRDNSAVEGHISGGIFFTSGYVDEKPVYTVLISTDKGLTSKNFQAEETYIRTIENGSAPRVEKLEYRGNDSGVFFWTFFNDVKYEYIIWVPADADIVDDYVVDLE